MNETVVDKAANEMLIYIMNTTYNIGKYNDNIIVPDNVLFFFLLINFWGPGQFVTVLGMFVNILNVVTFLKQGVKDSVNISLLALTISDLISLELLLLLNICWTPWFIQLNLPFYPQQMMYLVFYVHIIFTRATTGTTAWIAFERCLCIVAPLKVKSIVRPRRTVIFICCLYVFMIAAVVPVFYTTRLQWIFDATRNRTMLTMVKIANRERIEGVTFLINNIVPLIFFMFIVVCTAILMQTLHHHSQWRRTTMSSSAGKHKQNRDTQVAKMVFIISLVFILCYAPGAVSFIWVLIDPEIKIDGKQKNLMIAVFSVLLHLESINATANFFIYLIMSSKFRQTVEQMFGVTSQENMSNERQE